MRWRYFRLYSSTHHIIGFKRISQHGIAEYIALQDYYWTQKVLPHDAEILLSTPPKGIELLKQEKA